MIQMSSDMRTITMCVALCFYSQSNIVYALMLIDLVNVLFPPFCKGTIPSTNKTSAQRSDTRLYHGNSSPCS